MDIIKVIILGIVQGLTEFLPVSSSGHLVLAAEFLNFHEEGVTFEVFVHLGTLFSVLVVFRVKIFQMLISPYEIWIRKKQKQGLYRCIKVGLVYYSWNISGGFDWIGFQGPDRGHIF